MHELWQAQWFDQSNNVELILHPFHVDLVKFKSLSSLFQTVLALKATAAAGKYLGPQIGSVSIIVLCSANERFFDLFLHFCLFVFIGVTCYLFVEGLVFFDAATSHAVVCGVEPTDQVLSLHKGFIVADAGLDKNENEVHETTYNTKWLIEGLDSVRLWMCHVVLDEL